MTQSNENTTSRATGGRAAIALTLAAATATATAAGAPESPAAPGALPASVQPEPIAPPALPDVTPATVPVEIDGRVFELEVAADAASRAQGLMGRERIERGGGMIFVYAGEAPRRFWMGRCLVDMDLIYLDARGRVVSTHEMYVEAPRKPFETEDEYSERLRRYASRGPAQYAIELRAGTLRELNLRPGERIDLPLGALAEITPWE